jgi:predicted lysophospholipase L1 biosynthesis ABC-type transport system permease subunit
MALVRVRAFARRPLTVALAGYPDAQLLDQAGYASSRSATLGNILNLITALLVLAVIVALLGMVSTLALSVAERTRELGLLRAIGMRRGQVGQMIAAESVTIAVIGGPRPRFLSRSAARPCEPAAGSRTGQSPAPQRRLQASLTRPPASR